LNSIDHSPDRADAAVQQFLQEKAAPESAPPPPFDWTMVDILLPQLRRPSGDTEPFTRAMCDSVIFALFGPPAEPWFLQGPVAYLRALSVGETIANAPLSKVTLLSNVLVEIDEKYEREPEKRAEWGESVE
jgi:hypothetical protein